MNEFEKSSPENNLSDEQRARENRILQGVEALKRNRPIRKENSRGGGGGPRLTIEEYEEARRRYDEWKKERDEQ